MQTVINMLPSPITGIFPGNVLNLISDFTTPKQILDREDSLFQTVEKINFSAYFCAHGPLPSPIDHYEMAFKPAIFDVYGSGRYNFYKDIGFFDYCKMLRTLNNEEKKSRLSHLDNHIKNFFINQFSQK